METKKVNIILSAIIFCLTLIISFKIALPPREAEVSAPTTTKISQQRTTSSKKSTPKKEESTTEEKEDNKIDQMMKKMSLEEKVGQLVLARVPESNAIQDVQKYQLGGYILFDRDYQGLTVQMVRNNIDAYQKAAKIPMLMASDEEGGTVSRLNQAGFGIFPSPQALYQSGGFPAIKEDIKKKSELFERLGLNAGMAPDADIATSPNSFIYPRTFSTDLELTKKFVTISVETMQKYHIASTLKHFPGYGDQGDSHMEVIRDSRSKEELQAGLQPFKAGIDAGADSILVEHNIVEAYDDKNPASLSPAIHKLLRDTLNFKGVIMTDDMDMKGLSTLMTQEEAAIQAIKAGNDMIITSSYATQIPALVQAVKDQRIKEQTVDDSCRRILKWKEELGIIS